MSHTPVIMSIEENEIVVDIAEPRIRLGARDARRLADALHDIADRVDHDVADPALEQPRGHQGQQHDESGDDNAAIDTADHDTESSAPSPADVPSQVRPSMPYWPARSRILRSVRFSKGAREFMEDEGLRPGDIEEVVKHPHHRWEGINPGAVDKPTVAIREDVTHGAVYYPDDHGVYVISVKLRHQLEEERRDIDGGQPRVSGGPKRPAIDSLKTLVAASRDSGLDFTQGKTHGKIFDPERPELGHYTVAITPSDRRAFANAAAQIRKKFDVEL